MADATKAASACGQTLAEGAARRGRVAAGNAAEHRGRVAAGNAAAHRGRTAAGNAAAHRGRTAAGNAAARHVRLPLPGPSALARAAGRSRVAKRTPCFPANASRPQSQAPGPPRLHARTAGRSRAAEADALLPCERIQAIEPSPGPSALARTAGRRRAAETDAPFSGERIRPQNRVPGPVQCRPCGRRVRRDMAKTSEILHTKLAVTMIQYREESVLHQEERTR